MSIDADRPEISPSNRRTFLRSSALVAPAAALGVAALSSSRVEAARTGRTFKYPEAYPGLNSRSLKEIQFDENTHAATLVKLLGAAARPKPTFQGLEASSVSQFIDMANVFENTGAGAYLGAAPVIFSREILAQAGSFALVEAYHASFLNVIVNNPLVPDSSPFAFALTQEEVVGRASPFIVSLNGGPPASFDLTPSAANDINILNFALILEYLESTFYNINVPKFFP